MIFIVGLTATEMLEDTCNFCDISSKKLVLNTGKEYNNNILLQVTHYLYRISCPLHTKRFHLPIAYFHDFNYNKHNTYFASLCELIYIFGTQVLIRGRQ